ncbi:MAG: class I SAM-dependent methyltransferase [Kofleriaceae bacterium]|nr:class I SAM-dependent methyltransferase [Kofleriaceae bacterium]
MDLPIDELARCPTCSGTGQRLRSYGHDDQTWTCFACGRCDGQYWAPRVVEAGFYARDEQATYQRRRDGEGFLRPRHREFLRRARPGRLLDVGCGEGYFLATAEAKGYAVTGVDLDPGSIEIARGRGLTHVSATPLFDAGTGELAPELRPRAPFDWVTAFEVLEHQADPVAFLTLVRSLLAPDGALCGSVPNRDRLMVDRQRQLDAGDFPPHHFLWFSARSLEATLRQAGFSRISVGPVPEDDLLAYAAHLESTTLGRGGRRAGGSGAAAAPGRKAAAGALRSRVRGWLRTGKNVPFAPAALLIRKVRPDLQRALYFEARA